MPRITPNYAPHRGAPPARDNSVTAARIVIFNAPDVLCVAAGGSGGAEMSTEIMTRGNFAFSTVVYMYIRVYACISIHKRDRERQRERYLA